MKENDNLKELEKIIEEINYIIQYKKDPFEVNIREILEKLNQLFKKLDTIEELSKDAEAMDNLASIVREQAGILYQKTSSLFITSERLIAKLEKLNIHVLGRLMELCMHPIASIDYINSDSIKFAYEYWLAKNPIKFEKRNIETKLGYVSRKEIYVNEKNFLREMEEFESYLTKNLPYNLTRELEKLDSKERVKILYFISFLIAQGKVHIVDKNDELIIERGPSKTNNSIIFNVKI